MPYEAVNAYTVLVGEVGSTTTVSVHGSAEEAWRALAETVRHRSSRWMPRSGEAAALADRWRRGDPERRFWQVSAHQLQVMVPATVTAPSRPARPWSSRAAQPPPAQPPPAQPPPAQAPPAQAPAAEAGSSRRWPRRWPRRWRRPSPHSVD